MSDGSIRFDVGPDTDSFKNDLKNLKDFTGNTLKTLDEAIEAGAISGVSSMAALAESAFSKLMDFSEEEKQFLINNAESAKKTETERSSHIKNIRRAAAEEELKKLTDDERIKEELRERELQSLKNSLAIGAISEAEYYLKLKEYRDKYFSVGSKEWEDYTVDILKFCKDTAEDIAKAQKKAILSVFDDMDKAVGKSYEGVLKTQEKMEKKLSGYGSIFEKKSFKSPSTGNTYSWLALGDLDKDISVLKNYNNALVGAKELLYKIFPTSGEGITSEIAGKNKSYIKGFFESLSDMDIEEGMSFAAYLTRMPEEKVSEYLKSWAVKQELIGAVSKNLYSDEAKEVYDKNVENMAAGMVSKLEESFGELPDNFFDKGIAAALGFGDGFISSIESVFSNIRKRIDEGFREVMPAGQVIGGASVINNSTLYNIYGGESAKSTAMEIEKQDTLRRMLVGD